MTEIQAQIEDTTSDSRSREAPRASRQIVRRRRHSYALARATEIEMKEKKQRVEDALEATRAAVEEAYRSRWRYCTDPRRSRTRSSSYWITKTSTTGVQILSKALREPIRIIAGNCGFEGAVILDRVVGNDDVNFGFNAMTDASTAT